MKDKVKKKPQRFNLPVSRTNFNRVNAHTHSLEQILLLEGYKIQDVYVVSEGSKMHLGSIDLWPKKKPNDKVTAIE